ncbi:GIY-YIG nuclease family protein [Verrucomicrobiota bacterium]
MQEDSPFFYVYILQSESHAERFYTGFTTDIESRLKCHNSGSVPATKPYRPWRIKTCIAFSDESQARAFEGYLKTQSGRAFAKRRL